MGPLCNASSETARSPKRPVTEAAKHDKRAHIRTPRKKFGRGHLFEMLLNSNVPNLVPDNRKASYIVSVLLSRLTTFCCCVTNEISLGTAHIVGIFPSRTVLTVERCSRVQSGHVSQVFHFVWGIPLLETRRQVSSHHFLRECPGSRRVWVPDDTLWNPQPHVLIQWFRCCLLLNDANAFVDKEVPEKARVSCARKRLVPFVGRDSRRGWLLIVSVFPRVAGIVSVDRLPPTVFGVGTTRIGFLLDVDPFLGHVTQAGDKVSELTQRWSWDTDVSVPAAHRSRCAQTSDSRPSSSSSTSC